MALQTTALKNGIKDLMNELFTNSSELNPAQAADRFADGLSQLLETYVKSGDGRYQAGTLTAGANPVTSSGSTTAVVKIY